MIFKDELDVLKDLYGEEKLKKMFETAKPKLRQIGYSDKVSKIIITRTGGEIKK